MDEVLMLSAIYYPHTKIQNESLLKTALLLWDEIHVIVPWEGYRSKRIRPLEAEAFELIGRAHCPTEDEKQQVHDLVEDFATRPLSAEFRLGTRGHIGNDDYEMFAQKLLPDTWRILEEASMAHPVRTRETHFSAPRPTGLALMSLLADCCAGDTFVRVTDRSKAYSSLAGLLVDKSSERDVKDHGVSRVDGVFSNMANTDAPTNLVPMVLKVVDSDSLTLEHLIQLRRSELKSTGHALRDLRHRFSARIDAQAVALCGARSKRDRGELRRQFQEEMNDDYAALRDSLKLEAKQVVGTKEILTAMLVAADLAASHLHDLSGGVAALAAAGSVFAVGGLFSTKAKCAATRRKILAEHPTAYLYEARGGLRL
jgi:hypothetical protein